MSCLETLGHDPREIDPRPCEWCGLTIDRHRVVDEGEGPEFFCEEISADAADIVRRWEEADPRDRWRHTGEPRPATPRPDEFPQRQAYRTPQSTIDAFWVVARAGSANHLAAWLRARPADAPHLHKLWGQKCATAA